MKVWPKSHVVAFVLSTALTVLLVALVTSEWFRLFAIPSGKAAPKLFSPEIVELEEAELGKLVVANFQLANLGGQNLILTDFRSGCACDGLEYWNENRYIRFSNLTIEAGGVVDVRLAQRARGLIGQESRTFVSFLSNDAEKRETTVLIRISNVTGGTLFSVKTVEAGTIRLGDKFETFVDVFDQSGLGRKVEKIESTLPEKLKVLFIPPETIKPQPPRQSGGEFLGRIQVTLESFKPGPIHGTVFAYLAGKPGEPDKFLVNGRVAPLVEFAPGIIFLPRYSESGPIFNTTCICRSPFGNPFALSVRKFPKGLTVKLDNKEMSSTHTVNISITEPLRIEHLEEKEQMEIELLAKTEGGEMSLIVPVTIQNQLKR